MIFLSGLVIKAVVWLRDSCGALVPSGTQCDRDRLTQPTKNGQDIALNQL
ncbi:hypothetical protein H6G54_04500 [Anabaena cylindrica FACHB-243]|nr:MULTISPECIES: hypothetical protein [Anabaena]MBD2416985.1 hypothetical protein [Anabaena cylindrica FACHB-243]MBY5280200.1 hypothetical protein [Anabaena sp. CCAP 1446/1C]MBY5309357.1 hypothetical protein [Anabaena sp. CCAP 1446/1C]MCM2406521.1 hypothetical protein [Anabaena sp. CCAP 1446/1C]